ncbi:Putative secreted protein [Corynebacterium glyciniphilum AJ 3170]|uniref:Putative secreted protein n=1 Tax=Corynebacterium glyciniphilum AJ 3170 TaxID=1404245 RepID=X5EE18_9CORY|nr:hypothetical protein [Corynebacterium glyciniphilum]AHW65645.1 Putative secreted protein [Corynebacterium glyciniphilum AJ 3170]
MSRSSRLTLPVRPLACLAVAAVGLALTPVVPVAPAQDGPAGGTLWSNPEARSADPDSGVSLEILGQQPATVTGSGALDLRIRVTNSSDQELSGLQLRTQHQNAVDAPDGVATSLMSNQGEYPWVGPFQQLDGTLDPGEERQFRLTVPVDGRAGSLSGLGLEGPGVYPLLLNLNADLGGSGTSFVAATRTTVTVTETEGSDNTGNPDETATGRPAGITMLWPLSSSATAGAGQVGDAPEPNELYLPDESLAEELQPEGRLSTLLSTYRSAAADSDDLQEATCIAIDPDLLETVSRMSGGYRVGEAPSPVEEPVRLRDRWTTNRTGDDSVEGTGAADAASWLEELRTIVDGQCTVPLPFGGADVDAVTGVDDPRVTELSERGTETISDILDTDSAEGVVVPGSGYVSDASVQRFSTTGRETPTTVLVADDSVATNDGGEAGIVTLPGGTRALRFPAALGSALAATGNSPTTTAYSAPTSRRDLDDDSAAERMAAAVGVLDLELSGAGSSDSAPAGNVIATPPAEWTVDEDDAATWLEAVTGRLEDGSARAVSFGAALRGVASDGSVQEPEADPAPVGEGEVAEGRGLAEDLHDFTRIMVDNDNVALTPEIFTRPMVDDLLRSLTDNRRRVADEHAAARDRATERRGSVRALIRELRESVSLLPPGSVFTRTSDSSPLIVVARNGLPLPVRVNVDYESDDGVTLNTPGMQLIPAQGSVTLQMTTSFPSDIRETDLTMYLETPDDMRISDPVTIRMASGPGNGALVVGIGVAVVFGLFAVIRVTKRHRQLANHRGRARR